MTKVTLASCLRSEVSELAADPWLFSLVSWLLPVLSLLMWWMFSQGIATDLPVGIVDLDKSRLSRDLVRCYDASPALAVEDDFLDIQEGSAALKSGRIYGLVVIPSNLEKDTVSGRPPQVTAFINSQFLLVGKTVNSALLEAHGNFTIKVEVLRNMATAAPVADMALSSAMPVSSQATPLFNVSKNYAQFLISAILPAIWQIFIIAAVVLSLSNSVRRYGLGNWLGEAPAKRLFAKLGVLASIFWLHGVCVLSFMYVWLGWPMRGDWPLLIGALALTALASCSAGSLIFLVTRDPARALSTAAAYVAPGLAFMGVTFPVTDMTLPARIWRSLIPVCHYIEIQFSQVNYGAPTAGAWPSIYRLGLFVIPFALSLILAYHCARGARKPAGEGAA